MIAEIAFAVALYLAGFFTGMQVCVWVWERQNAKAKNKS